MAATDQSAELAGFLRLALAEDVPSDTLQDCGEAILSTIGSHPESVLRLAHRMLHSFHYSSVPTCWRRCYEEASLWKMVAILEAAAAHSTKDETWEDQVIELVDMMIIMTGAPGRRPLLDAILENLPSQHDSTSTAPDGDRLSVNKKRKRSFDAHSRRPDTKDGLCFKYSDDAHISIQRPIESLNQPSLAAFQTHVQQKSTPIVLQGTMQQWPALTAWRHPEYWRRRTHAGRRRVPVELGRAYTDEDWGQKIMPFADFADEHLQPVDREKSKPTGYLAQHDLLSQIPRLKQDIAIPDYCFIDTSKRPAHRKPSETDQRDSRVTVTMDTIKTVGGHVHYDSAGEDEFSEDDVPPICNLWLGPAHTISPCHTDPHHNLLAQVVGRKYIRLYSPTQTPALYAMSRTSEDCPDMANTSQVDVGLELDFGEDGSGTARRTQREQYPEFHKISDFYETILGPGELLYIPKGWWHYVRSLDVSASVSFWWG